MKTEFCLLVLLQPSIQSIQIGLGVIIAADELAVIQSMFTEDDIKANAKVMTSSIDLVVTVILSFGTCAPILMFNTKHDIFHLLHSCVLWVVMFQSKS